MRTTEPKSKLEKGVRVQKNVGARRRDSWLILGKGARGLGRKEADVKAEFGIPGENQKGVKPFHLPVHRLGVCLFFAGVSCNSFSISAFNKIL